MSLRFSLPFVVFALFALQPACGQRIINDSVGPDNPVLATASNTTISLRMLEEYISFQHKLQRVPRIEHSLAWRDQKGRELAERLYFFRKAIEMGLHEDPAYVRSRGYMIQEWMSFAMVRDLVVNRIEINPQRVREFYDEHKRDYFLTSTVSLRMIRTRSADKASSAMKRLASGESFDKVETEISEVNLRQRGKVLGPFPSTTTLNIIPPPKEVIEAAKTMAQGETSGPIVANNNYFIVRVVEKTDDFQPSFELIANLIEDRIRETDGERLHREMMKTLYDELQVQVDESVLTKPNPQPTDIIATIGTTLLPYREYDDLGGRVRGPGARAARFEPTKLTRFIVPWILTEGAMMRGYQDREEFRLARFYSDMLRLANRALNTMVDRGAPPPNPAEVRAYFDTYREKPDEEGHCFKNDRFEVVRDGIWDLLNRRKRAAFEKQLVDEATSAVRFHLVRSTTCTRITALEALVAAADQIPAGAQVQLISTTRGGAKTADELTPVPLLDCGRREEWRIVCVQQDGPTTKMVELFSRGPAAVYDHTPHFTSSPLYMRFANLWRFDSDALARHALDGGLEDFVVKYNRNVHINVRLEFQWEPGSDTPKNIWVVYEARPLAADAKEILTMRYSAATGQLVRKPIRECLPCEQMRQLMNEPY